MVLIDTEIQHRITHEQLLTNHEPGNIKNCGYSLRAGKVFQANSGEEDLLGIGTGSTRKVVWEIGPAEVLVVMTREKVKIPSDLCASYAPLYHLSNQGVMLLNASIVEPGYEGNLSCFLVNFSSERISLSENQRIAKITFHSLSAAPGKLQSATINCREYETMLAKAAKKFHRSFMDITGIEERAAVQAKTVVKKWVTIGGGIIAVLLLWASLEPFFSKWLYEKTGIYTDAQRMDDALLLKDLQAARSALDASAPSSREQNPDIEQLRSDIENLKTEVGKLRSEP